MKKNKLKKVFIFLFSFLFIASATVAGGVLLSGSSYSVPVSESSGEEIQDSENLELDSDEGSTENENNVTSNATEPTNDDSWANHYADSFAGGTGSEADPYQIETAEQLSLLAVNVNSGTNYSDIYFEQTADIDLSAYWWDAIGTYTSSSDYNEFAGHFNGGGHTVSGVFTQAGSTSTYNYQGLFGYVRGTSSTDLAEISNVGVIDSNIQGRQNVGGIVGYAYYTNITNCYNTGSVTSSSSYVGGVVGRNYSATVSNSYNTGTVTGKNAYVGGVVGYNVSSTVSNSYNIGYVTGNQSVGGVVGEISSSSTVSNSYNTGNVTSTYIGTYGIAGGVVGRNGSSTVSNSYNTGDVTSSSNYVGGVVGYNSSTVSNSYNTGDVTSTYTGTYAYTGGVVGYNSSSTVENSYNTGSVTGNGNYVGGVVGRNSSSTVSYCYYGGNCASSVGGIEGSDVDGQAEYIGTITTDAKTESWYGSSSTVTWNSSYPWDFTDTWGITQYANDGYPYLLDVGNIAPDNTDLMWTDSAVTTRDTDFEGSGTASDPYLISSAEELAGLAYMTNISTSTTYNGSGVYYRQTADIDLSAYWWDAIGTNSGTSYYFRGYYDGDGYTVSGVYTPAGSDSNYSYQGLFGYVYGASSTIRAEISNVGVINSNIQGYQYVAGIAGRAYYTNITNCYNTGTVTGSSSYVGGVVGYNSLSTVSNSYNTGSVTSSSHNVGGVVGYNYSSSITNSYNTGDVTSSSYNVGGVVGYNSSSTVSNSYNTGNVTGSSSRVGGVVGYNSSSTVSNSYNTGSVLGSDYVGGVVGYNYSSTVRNSYNTGDVTGNIYVGGVVGYNNYSSTITKCYFGGDYTGSYGIGSSSSSTSGTNSGTTQISSLNTTSYAKGISWYSSTSGNWNATYPWDFTYVWALDSSVNDGYPHFKEITVTYHSNFGDDETIEKAYYASSVIITSNIFTRDNYEIASWNTNQTGTGTSYTPGETYQIATDINLYAQWQGVLYNITLNHGNGNSSTTIYQRYATGFYSNSEATTEISSISVPTMNGYSFGGYYTGENGEGYQVIDEEGNIVVSNTFFTGNTTIYAYWEANVPAYYDSTNGYWYIEYGKMPQTKLDASVQEDLIIINALNGDSVLDATDGVTTSSNVYYFAGNMLSAKIYDGEEYCYFYGNWYRVEPVRWVLDTDASSSQSGYISTDTLAVMESVVYVGKYSETSLGVGQGYDATSNFTVVTDYLNNFNVEERDYLVEFSADVPSFDSSNIISTTTATNSIFLASEEEIQNTMSTYSTEFSDLVQDYLNVYGDGNYYFVRDLGSNLNNVTCYTQGGGKINQKPTCTLGMRLTIQVTEFVCL